MVDGEDGMTTRRGRCRSQQFVYESTNSGDGFSTRNPKSFSAIHLRRLSYVGSHSSCLLPFLRLYFSFLFGVHSDVVLCTSTRTVKPAASEWRMTASDMACRCNYVFSRWLTDVISRCGFSPSRPFANPLQQRYNETADEVALERHCPDQV
jgi:hypothetical protein